VLVRGSVVGHERDIGRPSEPSVLKVNGSPVGLILPEISARSPASVGTSIGSFSVVPIVRSLTCRSSPGFTA
jgi:hypothetical protein